MTKPPRRNGSATPRTRTAPPARDRVGARLPPLDRHALYEVAVQGVDWDLDFLERAWRYRNPGREPALFREDFCGTAALSTAWALRGPERRAWGVDLDTKPLEWARRHRFPYVRGAASRVTLVRGDVSAIRLPRVDIACALNFSWWVFHERAQLVRYLRGAHAALRPGGVLVLNMFGGAAAEQELAERTRKPAENAADGTPLPGFTYVWEHSAMNAADRRLIAHIHFEFKDGRRMTRAFTYDWRMYTIPELKDAVLEAGFSDFEVWTEGWSPRSRRSNGTLYRRKQIENEATWIAYVVASR